MVNEGFPHHCTMAACVLLFHAIFIFVLCISLVRASLWCLPLCGAQLARACCSHVAGPFALLLAAAAGGHALKSETHVIKAHALETHEGTAPIMRDTTLIIIT